MKFTSLSVLIILLAVFAFAGIASAEKDGFSQKLILEEHPKFLKYDEPKPGVANVRMLLSGDYLVVELLTPLANIHSVKTPPSARTPEEQAIVEAAKAKLFEKPQDLFGFDPANSCKMASVGYRLEQVATGPEQASPQNTNWRHFDVRAEAVFICSQAPNVVAVRIFNEFPRIKEVNVQYFAYSDELHRVKLTKDKPGVQIKK
jgi:hypothetical protein